MANIAATFISGLVLGSGAVYAFTSYFTEQSHVINYKLHRASAFLKEAATGEKQSIPAWKDTRPDVMNKYQQFASRISGTAIPLAKTGWNSTISSTASSVADIDINADKLVSIICKDNKPQ
ncbi:hypothetical protein LPJ66_009011 [Kickxella alabastrina]|uniref:Uncharacterized protein n=1 Tax=Kickxella alabastrina TaxID=61397 RepID=A0ACC1IAP2_9FUNG|nr:hypothetical protein LPJ66_009011 [Kickxella alabastrina]